MRPTPWPARFGLLLRCVKHSPSFVDQLEDVARPPTLHRQPVNLPQRTHSRYVKAYFLNYLMRLARHSVTLLIQTRLGQRNGVPAQNSLRFPLSGCSLPISPFRLNCRGREFRAAAQVVEAPLATR